MAIIRNFLAALLVGLSGARIWEIPLPKSVQDCYNMAQFADIQTYVGSTLSWLCESSVKKGQLGEPPKFDAQKTNYYKQLFDKSVSYLPNATAGAGGPRIKRQARRPRCVRKEYRMLTGEERRRFHEAVTALKKDTTVEPNKYDAIALLHELAVFVAHGGAGFLGWHRLYILMFETALIEVDPLVCLPYWDPSLDNELGDPPSSPVWSSEFFGNGQGPVVSGPFANWSTPKGMQLYRNVGVDGELISASTIEDILSRSRYEHIISSPDVEPRFDLEFHHGSIHVFCGGTMSQLDTAAFDPVFFLVHAFIDYIWELFRMKLRSVNVDPEQYPEVMNADSRHHSAAATGFDTLLQSDAYRNAIADSYEYESSPSCTSSFPECGSRYLTCLERSGRCVPVIPERVVPAQPDPVSTSSPIPGPGEQPSSTTGMGCLRTDPKVYGQPVQNDFCCDYTCDTNQWAMIPVKIISVRPPKFHKYRSYPVHNGRVDFKDDIYSPSAYTQTNRYITQPMSNPKTFTRCDGDESIGQVFLSSRGINYNGYYKEAAIVDQRMAVSISMGFVAVKRPSADGVSQAIIRAHDSCGRVCHASCKDPVTNQYRECKGAIAVNSEQPLMFGTTYDQAVMNVFDYEVNNHLPQFKTEGFFLTFHCDYHNDFPYADHSHTTRPPPTSQPVTLDLPTASSECQVTPQCILDVPCFSETRQCQRYHEKHACRGSCRAYSLCIYGRYFPMMCPEGQYFDNSLRSCLIGDCKNRAGSSRRMLMNNQVASKNININNDHRQHRHNSSRSQNARSYHSNLLSNVFRNLGG